MNLIEITKNKIVGENGKESLPENVLAIDPQYLPNMFNNVTDHIHKGEVLNQSAELLTKQLGGQFDVKIGELYVDKKSLKYTDTKKRIISTASDEDLANMDIEQIIFTKAIAKITANGFHDEFSPAKAININEKGVEFAWGNNVHICSNLTIMQAEHVFSTYRKTLNQHGKLITFNYEDILERSKQFMKEAKEKFEKDLKQIERWKNHQVSRQAFHEFLGAQFSKIQWVNHNRVQRTIKELQNKTLPINGLQLSRIAVEAQKPSYDCYNWDGDQTTVWNILNFGTEVIKVQNGSESTTLLRANSNWVRSVDEFFLN